MRTLSLLVPVLLVIGCGDSGGREDTGNTGSTGSTGATRPTTDGPVTGGPDDTAADDGPTSSDDDDDGDESGPAEPPPATYLNLAQLHAQAIAPTCTLNNGVCHNSQAYPDIHTTSTLLTTIGQPCNTSVDKREEFHDLCEPPGDRLVIGSAGLDLEIASVRVAPIDALTEDLTEVVVTLAAAPGSLPAVDAADIEVHRGDVIFKVGESGARVAAADGSTVTLSLASAGDSARAFFDDRVYPWNELMVRVGDVNGNGALGFDPTVAMIVPGDPMKSYMILRLIDEDYGDLMPRQCRTWSDEATRALGCFIAGLAPGTEPEAIDPYAPIDYASCTFDPIGLGICGTGATVYDVFAGSCGGSSCHVDEANPAAGLDLSRDVARASLLDAPSTQAPAMALVAPGMPEESYLLCKVDPACMERIGAQMPSGGELLAQEDIDLIRTWILDGAP